MKNIVTIGLIGIALMFTAGAAYSKPVEHIFSTTGQLLGADPFLRDIVKSGVCQHDQAALL